MECSLDWSIQKFITSSVRCCDSKFGSLSESFANYKETNDISIFIQCSIRYIYPIINKYSKNTYAFEENLSIGISEILTKIDTFNESLGVNIGTFITFIVKNAIINNYNRNTVKKINVNDDIDVEEIEQEESCFNCDILNCLNYKDKEMLFDMYGFNRIELSNDEMIAKYGKNYKSDVLFVIKMLK